MNDQEKYARSRPRNLQGLYIGKKDIHRYDDRIFHRVNHTRLKVNAIWVLSIS